MRRDLGNEIIVAIAAIGMLAVAIVFAIILSLSRNAENAATPTVFTGTSIAANTAVETIVPSAPQNEDTATATEPTAAPTDVPATNSPEPEDTSTAIPITKSAETSQHVTKSSQTPSSTKAVVTEIDTASPTKRATQQPAIATTIVPTDIPTETAAAQIAASNTPKPSATKTSSPVPPTSTFTPTIHPSVTPEPPTNTPRPSATFTASSIQPSSTARPTHTVIPASSTPQPPMASTPTSDDPEVEGCTDSGVQISNLAAGQKVKGIITLIGTAYNPNLLYYKIETRPDFSQFYTLYNRYETVVIQNELGSIDTSIFSPGIYWIKLTVVNKDNTLAPACAIPVIFQR